MWIRLPACTVLCLVAAGQTPPMQPYEMDWRDNNRAIVDASFLLDAPAGKHGFIRTRGGHLAAGDRPFRIWGINLSFAANTPSHQDAPVVAAHLARFGINCVRVHHADHPAPRGLIDPAGNDTRRLHAQQMDRLDFFIAELKKRGIYTNLNLNVGRVYKPGDGVRDAELLGYAKGLTYFDPRLIELQKEYARALLTHYNPYTKSEYRHEPAVAIVEMVNENSILESWAKGRLLGKQTRANPGTWADIPASYERDLTGLYNQWLKSRLRPEQAAALWKEAGVAAGAPLPRLKPSEFHKASALRFRTEADFYLHLERSYFDSMRRYLREELGVKQLLVGTSIHNASLSPYPLQLVSAELDIIDAHTYWQHPRYLEDPITKKRTGYSIGNTPMVDQPGRSTVVNLSRAAVAGKPFTVSEVNHPYPNEYAAEGVPILAAYGAFQDWDGIFWYTLEHNAPSEWIPKPPGHFDFRQDPVKMTQLAAGAMLFLRRDVSPAARMIARHLSRDDVLESIRLPASEQPFFYPSFPPLLALVHGIRTGALDRARGDAFPAVAGGAIRSDTKQLLWELGPDGKGLVVIDTPLSQGLIGHPAAAARPSGFDARISNGFCAITLHSLDGRPIQRSTRLLLCTGARAGLTGRRWNAERTSLVEPGTPPMRIEPVAGSITLKGLAGARSVQVQPLDGGAKALGRPWTAERDSSGWKVTLGATAAPWYLVQVTR